LTPTELPGITDPPILFSPESAAIAMEAVPSKRAAARAILVLFNILSLHRWIVVHIVAVFIAGFFNDGVEMNASTNFELRDYELRDIDPLTTTLAGGNGS
jgi:hypothetical protein